MLDIPGIDPDKVSRYGKRFLKLIRDVHKSYEAMMQEQEDRPMDPNHQNVIDISSDEEDAEYGSFNDNLGLDDGSQEERSTYFQAAPEVDSFNARRT